MRGRSRIALLVGIALVGGAGCLYPGAEVPYVQTPTEVVTEMLRLAGVNGNDVVYDLGSGDGRIVNLAAERYGARGVGVEIDPQLVWFARRSAKRARVAHLVRFLNEDALTVDINQLKISLGTNVSVELFQEHRAGKSKIARPEMLPISRGAGTRVPICFWPSEES